MPQTFATISTKKRKQLNASEQKKQILVFFEGSGLILEQHRGRFRERGRLVSLWHPTLEAEVGSNLFPRLKLISLVYLFK